VALFITSSFATEEHMRVASYEPVVNFQVDVANGELSFMAYRRLWQFNIWLTSVHEGNTEHFHGSMKDDPDSYASFSLISPSFTGMIITSNDTFWVERKYHVADPALYIHRSSDLWLHPSMEFSCGHAGEPQKDHSINTRGMETRNHAHADGPVSVNVWMDQNWLSSNNPWFSTTSTYGILNDVNLLYTSVGLHAFAFNQVGQRSNSWTQPSQVNSMLNDFSAWAANGNLPSTVDVGFWLIGLNVGGLAWIGTGCSTTFSTYYRTGVAGLIYSSGNTNSRLWTVKTIAHELGHLRGAQHYTTNQCVQGESTGCQCSVMSFCFPTSQTPGGATNALAPVSIAQIFRSCP